VPASGATPEPFGFTGELHHDDLVYLRARWYDAASGTFTSHDPFAGFERMPYSLHPYQYAYSNPVLWTDPSGACVNPGDPGYRPELDCDGFDSWTNAPDAREATEEDLDTFQMGLDAAGMAPVVGEAADLINAGIYAVRGEWGDAVLSCAALIPFLGWGATGARYGDEVTALVHVPRTRGNPNPIGEQGPFYNNGRGPGERRTYTQSQYDEVMARRARVMSALDQVMQPFLPRIRAIAGPNVRIGYRGSLARGTVGNPNKSTQGMPVDLDNFDIDFLIVDNRLARTITRDRRGARWGRRNEDLRSIINDLEQALLSSSELSGLRKGSTDFRVWTQSEARRFSSEEVVYFP
jgi:RHS repeat-associated protein